MEQLTKYLLRVAVYTCTHVHVWSTYWSAVTMHQSILRISGHYLDVSMRRDYAVTWKSASLLNEVLNTWDTLCQRMEYERLNCQRFKDTDVQHRYSQIHKEAFAVVFALKKFHQFLYGRHFILVTEQNPCWHCLDSARRHPFSCQSFGKMGIDAEPI